LGYLTHNWEARAMPAGIAMSWLTKLFAPPLALAAVTAFFMAAQTPHPAKEVTAEADTATEVVAQKPTKKAEPATPPAKGLISDWRPDVDQAIDQLETWLSEEHPQQELNYSMANLAALYDTKLYLVFIDYLASLDPSLGQQALQEQQAWLQLRTERTATARLTNGEGSLASYNASETYISITHGRIDTLTAQMQKPAQ
jgi:uncharacterized protein YecT (DUF1311 family)